MMTTYRGEQQQRKMTANSRDAEGEEEEVVKKLGGECEMLGDCSV